MRKFLKKFFQENYRHQVAKITKKNNNLVINNNFKIIQIKNEKFIQNKKKE